MRQIDYLVVGQGLAGILLVQSLLNEGQRIFVIDHPKPNSASRIASGIMNPITGRRFVKSWMFEELMPVAWEMYTQLEKILKTKLIYRRNIIRSVRDSGGINDWLARSAEKAYAPYVVEDADQTPLSTSTFHPFGKVIESTGSYQLDIPLLVEEFTEMLVRNEMYQAASFEHGQLKVDGQSIKYKNLHARAIIFCEGAGLINNPLFGDDLLHPSIGERLIVQSPELNITQLIKRKYFIAPLANGNFWYGADTHWNFEEARPTNSSRDKLLTALRKTISRPYEVIDHQAAVRPTVRDRRPILGKHPGMNGVYIFNGLGTKGASLSPYWSQILVKHLIADGSIPKEVSIQRFF